MGSVYDLDRAGLAELLADEPGYRVDQVWRGSTSGPAPIDELTDLPKAVRARLGTEPPDALTPGAPSRSATTATR